jgi:energy-coupling factor transport system ATP-binding protein
MRVSAGQIAALIGDNGSGKSTLARLAAGLIQPQSGEVRVVAGGGPDPSPEPDYGTGKEDLGARRSGKCEPAGAGRDETDFVGLMLQNPDEQFITSSVERELAWGLENMGVPPLEMEERVRRVLERFDLGALAGHPPEALSDGQKQVVALASLAAMRPRFLLLDEAVAFLDPFWRGVVARCARELSQDAGVLWITSRLNEAPEVDARWLMADGSVRSG